MSRPRVIIVGSKGRMGEALMRLGAKDPALELIAGVDRDDDLLTLIDRCDVLIEFAHHAGHGGAGGARASRAARRSSSARPATRPRNAPRSRR